MFAVTNRKFALSLGLFALAATVVTALSPSTAQAQFRPGEVKIRSVSSGGSGCPEGSVRAEIAPDGSSISVLYDQFQARVGPGVNVDRKDCNVMIILDKPAIFSFALESADFRGFVHVSPGSRARQKVTVFSGLGDLMRVNVNLGNQVWNSPTSQNYVLQAVKPVEGLSFLGCIPPNKKARMQIKSEAIVENGGSGAEAMISVDTADGRLVQRYNLRWINCLQAGGGIIGGILGGLNQLNRGR